MSDNIEHLYKASNVVIKFFDDYCLIASKAKHKANQGGRLKNINSQTKTSKIASSPCTKSRN